MPLLTSIRSVLLITVVIFAIIALGLNANLLSFATFNGDDDDHSDLRHKISGFTGTGVGIAALTLLLVSPIMVMNLLRQRSGAAMVLLEIGWVSILMILWVTAAGQASGANIFSDGCSNADDDVQTFFLLWLAVVMVVAAMAHIQGHTRVWLYPFCDAVVLCRPPPRQSSNDNGQKIMPNVVQQNNGIVTQQNLHTQQQQIPTLNVAIPHTSLHAQSSPISPNVRYTPTSPPSNPPHSHFSSSNSQPPRYPSPIPRIPPPVLLPSDISHPNSRLSLETQNSNNVHGPAPLYHLIPAELPPVPQSDYRPLPPQPVHSGSQHEHRPLPPQPIYTPLTQEEISKLPQV
ncbi:hypothetical protein Clacol_001389 [Clathrus columnatus]|uniref:Uncharacterized protein n=1 Tax=Clathrus columnatus TaxID=1419009 RepID=A0AAV5A1L7_9AGAM|nr:hypothetical protein Clacol_001389 [Clathrus columnatus]